MRRMPCSSTCAIVVDHAVFHLLLLSPPPPPPPPPRSHLAYTGSLGWDDRAEDNSSPRSAAAGNYVGNYDARMYFLTVVDVSIYHSICDTSMMPINQWYGRKDARSACLVGLVLALVPPPPSRDVVGYRVAAMLPCCHAAMLPCCC